MAEWVNFSAGNTRAHDQHFGAKIHWASTFDGVELPARLLTVRPRGENAEMSCCFLRILEKTSRPHALVSERVRTALAEGLSSGVPAAASVARELGMSERSLRRALEEEGTTYRALLDDLRREAVLSLLQAKKSVTETAFLLGSSEASAFSRAFRRWHGTSTREALRSAR